MEAELLDLMSSSVTVAPWSSFDQFAVPSFGAGVAYTCRISMRDEYVRSKDGRETMARGRIYVSITSNPFTVKDKVTMPAGYVPANPPILDVQPEQDEKGIHHVVLVIG